MKKRRSRQSLLPRQRFGQVAKMLRIVRLRTLMMWGASLSLCLLGAVGLGEFVRQYPLKQIKLIATFQQVPEPVLVQSIQRALQKNIQRVRASTFAEFVDKAVILDGESLPLMAINVQAIRDDLSHFAWIDEVKVARRWPHTLEVTVQEQVPAAAFNDAYWVNSRGELFAPMVVGAVSDTQSVDLQRVISTVALMKVILPPQVSVNARLADKLPHLSGPLDQAERIIRMYQQYANLLRAARFSPFVDSQHGVTIGESRLVLRELQLTDQLGWILGLQLSAEAHQNPLSFTVSLDQDQPLKKLQRFIYFYDQLAVRRTEIKSVDVRYAHGLAVEWRDRGSDAPLAAITLE